MKSYIESKAGKNVKYNDGWSFAKVNGRLAEIHFNKKFGVYAHGYVERSDFKGKREQKTIDADIKKCQFTYRNGYYFDQLRGIKTRAPKPKEVFPKKEKTFGPFNSAKEMMRSLEKS